LAEPWRAGHVKKPCAGLPAVPCSGTLAARFVPEAIVTRLLFAVALTVLLAGSLCADTIVYYKSGPRGREMQSLSEATVTGWSASKVDYKDKDGKAGSLVSRDVLSIQRSSKDLSKAVELLASKRDDAMAMLRALATGGSALDKEEATYWTARTLAGEANGNARAINDAISAAQTYVKNYKSGFFAREMYRTVADLQARSRSANGARSTLKAMIGADAALAREGNQLLGQLEYEQGKIPEAIGAFQTAKSLALRERDKNGEYLAQAWEGLATVKKGDANAARAMLESVTGDESFEDNSSGDDEMALAIAYPALGDAYVALGNHQKAYDAFISGAYYAWWTQDSRAQEGYSLGEAYKCAKKLEGVDEKWKARKKKLHTALALGFPLVLQKVDKDG
jgi:tetratricopeptide (TPR) repeat protein